jgi:cyanophycinase
VALVGAGEFLPGMAAFDRDLLASIDRARPRVVILPTASAPDGEAVFRRWADLGADHFAALGAEVEPVLIRNREEANDEAAAQAIGEADLIYLSGGKPAHLRRTLEGTRAGGALWAGHQRGAVIAGCSAGAMVLAARQPEFRRGLLPWPLRWKDGLGLVDAAAVLPHYDAWPEVVFALMALQAPRHVAVIGIDEDTAVVCRDGAWQVHGRARVTLWRGRHRERFRRGEVFRI